jgi:hypothetical protein
MVCEACLSMCFGAYGVIVLRSLKVENHFDADPARVRESLLGGDEMVY